MTNLAHNTTDTDTADEQQAAVPSGLELVTSKALNPIQVFTQNGLDPILERIEQEARSIALDISTPKGRKEVASLAHKIAKSKTALDEAGKKLVAGWKEQAKKVDVERSRGWDRLEALQKEIRLPLTDWENREKRRIADHEANLAEIATSGTYTAANWQTMPVEEMNDRLKTLLSDKTDWQEFSVRAKQEIETATDAIAGAILKRQKHDSEQAELARLRKEEEERKQRARDEALQAEAAAKAKREAEEKARKEAEAEAARVKAEQEKAERERQRIQREKEEAEARAAKAQQELIDAEERAQREKEEADARAAKAEKDRIAAEKKAKEDAFLAAQRAELEKKAAEEAAAKRERDRIAAEQRAQAEATAKREADKAHRRKINTEALAAISSAITIGDKEEADVIAKRIVEVIALGEIPHIRIQY